MTSSDQQPVPGGSGAGSTVCDDFGCPLFGVPVLTPHVHGPADVESMLSKFSADEVSDRMLLTAQAITIKDLRAALEAAQGENEAQRQLLGIELQKASMVITDLIGERQQLEADLAQARARITELERVIRDQVRSCGRCGGLGTIHGLRGVEVCGECNSLRDILDAQQAAGGSEIENENSTSVRGEVQ